MRKCNTRKKLQVVKLRRKEPNLQRSFSRREPFLKDLYSGEERNLAGMPGLFCWRKKRLSRSGRKACLNQTPSELDTISRYKLFSSLQGEALLLLCLQCFCCIGAHGASQSARYCCIANDGSVSIWDQSCLSLWQQEGFVAQRLRFSSFPFPLPLFSAYLMFS